MEHGNLCINILVGYTDSETEPRLLPASSPWLSEGSVCHHGGLLVRRGCKEGKRRALVHTTYRVEARVTHTHVCMHIHHTYMATTV